MSDWRLPGFVELKELGAGAQGRVVLARHQAGGNQVAIKYLASGLLGDEFARDTFRSEAALLLLWPAEPGVGGTSHGDLRASFSMPGVLLGQSNMPASESPYMQWDLQVAPARALPGTPVTVTTQFRARTPRA